MPNSHQNETIREVLLRASRFFESQGIQSALYDAEQLLLHVLGLTKTQLLLEWSHPFPFQKLASFLDLVKQRGAHVPLQYLLGTQEFYGRDFHVSPAVLIPRPETELLIEQVLKQKQLFHSGLHANEAPLIADIGTGSGAIAVTLACEWPEARVVAVDLSPEALEMAKHNATRLGVESRIEFLQGDLITPLLERGLRPDILVSNPPYIPTKDCEDLQPEVRDHEPRLALDGGEDGMNPYRLLSQALPKLWPASGPAFVAYEVGIHQGEHVEAMIQQAVPDAETGILPDWQGIGRVIWGRRK